MDSMMDLSFFMMDKVEQSEETEVLVSERFKDKKGNVIKWRIKPISADENTRLRNDCTRRTRVPNKRNRYENQFDQEMYVCKLLCACVVYPNLNNAELQASWGVFSGEDLLRKMLSAGEYDSLMDAVQEVCGYYLSTEEKLEEAKN